MDGARAQTVVVSVIVIAALMPLGCHVNPSASSTEDAGSAAAHVDAGNAGDAGADQQGVGDAGDVEGTDGGVTANADAGTADAGSSSSVCGDGVVDGCTAAATAGDYNCQLEHDGLPRTYLLHVPAAYAQRPATGADLVLNFHGLNTTAALQVYLSKMNDSSDALGYIVVYPEGTGPVTNESWNAGSCCSGAVTNNVDDVGFSIAIIEKIESTLCIDHKRVFATGLSNGGHFVYRLACERADVIAAISPVAGVLTTSPCSPSRPVPVLHFHGDADPIVNYYTGIDGVNGAEQTVAAWASRDGCSTPDAVTYQNGEATIRSYPSCDPGTDVELCTISGGGHQWPGGNSIPLLGHNTTDISATDTMMTFFDAHPMP